MPRLDYALLCDFAPVEGGLAHIIGAGIDTIYAPTVPTGQNLTLLARLAFSKGRGGRTAQGGGCICEATTHRS